MGRWTVSVILLARWLQAIEESHRFITRDDASPLMGALVLWRTTALQSHPTDLPSRAPSPAPQSEEEPLSSSDERDEIKRSNSDPVELSRKPTSSSWSRWWSRSRNREVDGSDNANRPELRETASDAVRLDIIRVRDKSDGATCVQPIGHGTQTKNPSRETNTCITDTLSICLCTSFNTCRETTTRKDRNYCTRRTQRRS